MEQIQTLEFVTIGELVRLTGIRYSTLKHYTEVGLLPFEQSEANLTRRYHRVSTIKRLERIVALKEQGVTIPEIKARLRG